MVCSVLVEEQLDFSTCEMMLIHVEVALIALITTIGDSRSIRGPVPEEVYDMNLHGKCCKYGAIGTKRIKLRALVASDITSNKEDILLWREGCSDNALPSKGQSPGLRERLCLHFYRNAPDFSHSRNVGKEAQMVTIWREARSISSTYI